MKGTQWILLLVLAIPVRAQNPVPASPIPIATGARVRVLVGPDLEEHVGRVAAMSRDSLVLTAETGRSEYRWPTSSLRKLELSHGMNRNAFAGGVIGLLVGGLVGYFIDRKPEGNTWFDGGGVVAGSLLGAPVGAMVGTFVRTEAWTEIFSNVRVRVAVTPKTVSVSVPLALEHWR